VLTDDELKKVWTAAENVGWPYGSAVQLLILTGARRAEISELRWSEVNGENINLAGSRTKNGAARNIPLTEQAWRILKDVPRIQGNEFVFGRALRGGWSGAKNSLAVKIDDWRIHDLRRTASTGMNELGIEPHIVEAVLGHTVQGVAGIYNRAKYETAKRAALDAWGTHISQIISGR
jgi:integrase